MDTNKRYLEQLSDWGDELKKAIVSNDFPEEKRISFTEQLSHWQNKISELIADESRNYTDETIQIVKEEGEQLLARMQGGEQERLEKNAVPYGNHQLPPLPYEYNALEPYISEEIMRLHHDKHHQSYVDGLNEAEKALYTNQKGEAPIKHWLRNQAFNGSGHYLHIIFWYNMTPNSSRQPSGSLLKKIEQDFGSWPQFKKLFTKAANSVEGNGWTILLWAPRSGRLTIQTFEKHQLFHIADTIPLLVLDLWEHAYYLQYKTNSESYVNNWWNVVNWKDVNHRYNQAKKV